MTREDVEIVEHRIVYQGFFRLDRYRLRHRLHDGGWSGVMTREVFERGHAVAMLLFDPVLDVVVMVEQFRIGALTAGFSPWLLECPAGIIEEGETPEDVARREAVEETGCPLGEMEPVARYLASPGGSSETIHVYCGRVDASAAGGVHGIADEHEDLKVVVVPVAEALSWLNQGVLDNALTLIALQWLALNHQSLRQRWLPPRP